MDLYRSLFICFQTSAITVTCIEITESEDDRPSIIYSSKEDTDYDVIYSKTWGN